MATREALAVLVLMLALMGGAFAASMALTTLVLGRAPRVPHVRVVNVNAPVVSPGLPTPQQLIEESARPTR